MVQIPHACCKHLPLDRCGCSFTEPMKTGRVDTGKLSNIGYKLRWLQSLPDWPKHTGPQARPHQAHGSQPRPRAAPARQHQTPAALRPAPGQPAGRPGAEPPPGPAQLPATLHPKPWQPATSQASGTFLNSLHVDLTSEPSTPGAHVREGLEEHPAGGALHPGNAGSRGHRVAGAPLFGLVPPVLHVAQPHVDKGRARPCAWPPTASSTHAQQGWCMRECGEWYSSVGVQP